MSLTAPSKLFTAKTSAPFFLFRAAFGAICSMTITSTLLNPVMGPAVTSQASRAVFSETGASTGLQQLNTASEWPITPITVPVTVPVIATHFRGDFGLQAIIWAGLKVWAQLSLALTKLSGFTVSWPQHTQGRGSVSGNTSKLRESCWGNWLLLWEQLEFPCWLAQRFRLQFFLRSLMGPFVELIRATHLQLTGRAWFTRIQRQL